MPRNTSGLRRGGGRPPGVPNKFTTSFKHGVLKAYDRMGGVEGLVKWGKSHKTDFYKIAARLIPTEMSIDVHAVRPLVIDAVNGEDLERARLSDGADE